MIASTKLPWAFLTLFAFSTILIVAARYSSGSSTLPPQRTKIKVLRRQDQLSEKPTAKEMLDEKPAAERVLKDEIPKHLPIKAKLRSEKEKAFKDLNNDKWARSLEIEVKNTGTRPIYYLVLAIDLPEVLIGETNIIFSLRFGDKKFANFASGARPEDLSLKPGQTTILTIKQANNLDWNDLRYGSGWSNPKLFILEFQELSYGDGTGFIARDGTPWPAPSSKQSETGA